MTLLQEMIASHPFMKGVDPRFEHLFSECATFTRYGIGDLIFREGQKAEHFYLIHTGRVVLETFAPGVGEVTIQTLDSGEALGWSWLFPPFTWHFSAKAVEPAELIAFGTAFLRERIEENPSFGRDLVLRVSQILLQRLQATRLQLLDFYAPHL
jgi:CRP-like cAMP-binding protein